MARLLATMTSREGRGLRHRLQATLFERFGEVGCLLWHSMCTLKCGVPFTLLVGVKGHAGSSKAFQGFAWQLQETDKLFSEGLVSC